MFHIVSCSNSKAQNRQRPLHKDATRVEIFPAVENGNFIVDEDIELHEKSYVLPANVTLMFKGGSIKNGTLIGTNTKIIGTKKLFDKVEIKGTWNVKDISAEMFVNPKDTNVLKNVCALSNPQILNTIYIPKGQFVVKAEKGNHKVLKIPSNTRLILDGDIRLSANRLTKYSIFSISNSHNVIIEGKGRIWGDRKSHLDNEGQWGMCIAMTNVTNVKIQGLSVLDAWGDGIYIGRKSDSVMIDDCYITSCRRQGISVIGGNCVRIKNCKVKNIRGQAPEYAIDIEPNSQDTIIDVLIDNVIAEDCIGGFKSYSSSRKKNYISNVKIINSRVIRSEKIPFNLMGANNVELDGNSFENCRLEKQYNFSKSKNIMLNKKKYQ